MTLDGFLTILALLAAIYAVLSPVQRMRAALSWKSQVVLALPACALILGFELFDWRPPACASGLEGLCGGLVLGAGEPGPARKLAFLIALAWLTAAVFIHQRTKPSLDTLPAFARLATALIDEELYGDALKLLEPNMPLVARASQRGCWRQRFRRYLTLFGPAKPGSFEEFGRSPGRRRFRGETWPQWASAPVRWLAILVPADRRAQQSAEDLMQLLLTSPKILNYIVEVRPQFVVHLVAEPVFGDTEFMARFLTRLIANPSSALYHELSTNDASDGLIGYRLEPRNRLLYFLFADARIAKRLSVWKPVGDFVNRLLEGEERPGYPAWLNEAGASFDEEQMRDPTWMGLFFFDLMVTSAVRQGVGYHMWLLYLPLFARRLEAGYDSTDVDRNAEFPTRGARLLYEIVNRLSEWVTLFQHLPPDSAHRTFSANFGLGKIPHTAAMALAEVLQLVVTSNRLEPDFAQLLHGVTLRTVRTFPEDAADASAMRPWLVEALLRGDRGKGDRFYWTRLAVLFDKEDSYDRCEMKDYELALERRLS